MSDMLISLAVVASTFFLIPVFLQIFVCTDPGGGHWGRNISSQPYHAHCGSTPKTAVAPRACSFTRAGHGMNSNMYIYHVNTNTQTEIQNKQIYQSNSINETWELGCDLGHCIVLSVIFFYSQPNNNKKLAKLPKFIEYWLQLQPASV